MELSTVSVLLGVILFGLSAALVVLIIKFVNYKEETREEINEFIGRNNELVKSNNRHEEFNSMLDSENTDLKHKINTLKGDLIRIKEYKENVEAHSRNLELRNELSKVKITTLEEENKYLLEYGPNILSLNQSKKMYDKLVDGTETVIKVENKKYWQKQLLNADGEFKEFHVVEISNGRREGHERTKFITKYIESAQLEKSIDDKQYFHIYLGDRLN